MKKVITLTLCLALLFAVCIPANAEVAQKNSFTMYSCYVEAEVAGLVELFTQETGIEVKYVRLSAGEMQARVAAEKDNPQVAMIFGMGNDLSMAMAAEDLLDPYVPANIDQMDQRFVDPNGMYVPLQIIVTCFGSNADWLAEKGLEPPTSWDDLLKPEYQGEVCVAHPATSGAAYTVLSQCLTAHLTVSRMTDEEARALGDAEYKKYLQCKTRTSLVKMEMDDINKELLDAGDSESIISLYSVFKYKCQHERFIFRML